MPCIRAAFFLGTCLAAAAQECHTPDQVQGTNMLSVSSTNKKRTAAGLSEESSVGANTATKHVKTFTVELQQSLAPADIDANTATESDPCINTSNSTVLCNGGSVPMSAGNYTCRGEILPGRLLQTTCAPTAQGPGLLDVGSDGEKYGYRTYGYYGGYRGYGYGRYRR
mmetsp:Transcript_87783/g.196201  ORF Transcript_87783/g.196201 Transcript_87783/m.196201 type:complete len:168 (-) Transcript_87783:189-692(-)